MNKLTPIPAFEDLYSATIDGRIFSHRSYEFMHPVICNGYRIVRLCLGSTRPAFKVSRLIASTFLGLDLFDPSIEVDHGSLGKLVDSVNNLQLLSHHDNILKHHNRLGIDTETHKFCLRCKDLIPRERFGRNAKAKDGLKSICRLCRNKG